MKIELSIIVISYNTKEMTLACLQSIREQTHDVGYEVLVGDNASKDGSADAIARHFTWVQLYNLKENIGFAAANNYVAQYAQGEYMLLLNPDTVVKDRAIDQLMIFAKENPKAGIWGGRTVFRDGSLNNTCCYNNMSPWSLFSRTMGLDKLFNNTLFNPETFGNWHYDSIEHVDIITGCFFLITKSAWVKLEGFNPLYYMYGEEVDLCIRAKKAGFGPMYTPNAEIIHHGGASENGQSKRMQKVFRAKMTLIREHWTGINKWLCWGFLQSWVASRAIWYILLKILKKSLNDKQEAWVSLWRTRKDWIKGF